MESRRIQPCKVIDLGYGPMQPGEVEADFSPHFDIEVLMRRYPGQGYLAGEAA